MIAFDPLELGPQNHPLLLGVSGFPGERLVDSLVHDFLDVLTGVPGAELFLEVCPDLVDVGK